MVPGRTLAVLPLLLLHRAIRSTSTLSRMQEKKDALEDLTHVPSHQVGEVQDAVFGEITEGGPNYRNVRAFIQNLALQPPTDNSTR